MKINSTITMESIIDMCLDLFFWSYKNSVKLRKSIPEEVENDVLLQHYYEVGKMDGFNEGMTGILLPVIGAEEMRDVINRAIEGVNDEESVGE